MPVNSFHNFLSSPPPRTLSLLCLAAGVLSILLRWLCPPAPATPSHHSVSQGITQHSLGCRLAQGEVSGNIWCLRTVRSFSLPWGYLVCEHDFSLGSVKGLYHRAVPVLVYPLNLLLSLSQCLKLLKQIKMRTSTISKQNVIDGFHEITLK